MPAEGWSGGPSHREFGSMGDVPWPSTPRSPRPARRGDHFRLSSGWPGRRTRSTPTRLLGCREAGRADGVAESLFKGYFNSRGGPQRQRHSDRPGGRGRDPTSKRGRLLAGDEGRAEMQAEDARYKALGVSSVPDSSSPARPPFSGAFEPQFLAYAIRRPGGLADDGPRCPVAGASAGGQATDDLDPSSACL